ncbi:hypothetical protein GTZ99_04175 [Novosphingobium sp. FSY-8]|uniref:Uncharacterized protein n=1 Tax=Novosphingobium ovatum TaxID=1908523 RepID=A0ABW9XB34_9SPHN|nr:hypothetical protein [Novosphingobium ovatum]NBC35751.1 hypothetical protein [Novosphingobium ovatum]
MSYQTHTPSPRATAKAAPPPLDPRDRLRRFGPIRPMQHSPSLIERILFS